MRYLILFLMSSVLITSSVFGDIYDISTQNGKTLTNTVVRGLSKYTRLGKLSASGSLVLTDLGFSIFQDEDTYDLGIDIEGETNYLCTVEAAENRYLSKNARINGVGFDYNNRMTITHTQLGAAPASITNQVNINSRTVQLWETYWGGSNLVMEVTNYYGNTSGEVPKLRLLELITTETGVTNYTDWVWDFSSIPEEYSDITISEISYSNNKWNILGSYYYNEDSRSFNLFTDGSEVDESLLFELNGGEITIIGSRKAVPETVSEYKEIWNDSNKFDMFTNFAKTNLIANATNSVMTKVNSELDKKADRAWGKYSSAGGDAPATNIVYMTAPTTYFAGGLEFEKVAVGNGTISVLVTKGAQAYTYGMEGQFRIGDASGTDYFGYNKTESYTVGTTTDGISVNGSMVCLTYNIISSTFPIIYYSPTLDAPVTWTQLNDPAGDPVEGSPYSVTFDDSTPGTYLAYINCGDNPSGFFKAETSVVGECVFVTSMLFDPIGGIRCTNVTSGASVKNVTIYPEYNNGVVTWRVKQ